MDKDFNEFWNAYQPDENRFPRRRAATFRAWNERTPAARKAILAKVKAEGAPKWKNPYFYVADFPEPEPYNWNGDPRMVLQSGKETEKIRFLAKICAFGGTLKLLSY